MNRLSPAAATACLDSRAAVWNSVRRVASYIIVVACASAHAQVTPLDWYHMGEGDGATVAGQTLTTTADTIGTKTLLLEGNVQVATDIGASAVSSLGSTRSLHFATAGTDYGHTTSVLTTAIDNFGLEAWVKPTSASSADQTIVYNGRPGFNGWGIVLKSGTTFQAQFGPVVFGSATATIGTWTHVAVVRDNGIATFYVNGVAASAPEFSTPTTPTFGFGVGNGVPAFDTGLQGFVDEVRVFTLSPGNFSSTQLLLGAKRVSNTLDSGAGSLRTALASVVPGDTIAISATGTIALASPLPIITSGVYIFGPGASNLSVSGANANRVFFVDLPGDATTSLLVGDLSIANGAAKGGAGGDGGWGGGGGMGAGGGLFVNAGNVVLSRVNFTGNAATGGKGGKSNGSGCGCKGGGGGLGGAGGSATGSNAAGGGGGFLGNGGSAPNNTGSGGGGGITGNGGSGGTASGGGGGAFAAGANGGNLTGGAGADGIGGDGASYGSSPPYDGVDGLEYGGGGGAAEPGNGGNGGRYGGGGGSSEVAGGAGGDFGGSGGGGISGVPTPGGFGGGSGGVAVQNSSGAGGFGGGTGGSDSIGGGAPGAFAGHGGVAIGGAGGGGGGALGGAIFVRASNGATLTWNDGSADAGSVTAGAGGAGSGGNGAGNPGSTSGSAMFLLGGTTTLNVSSGQQAILGSLGGWNNQPPNITKTGAGTLVLPGGGSDLGTITVSKGDLRVSFAALNLASTKEVDVSNTATLSGLLGTVGGPVKLASGGTISPGDPANAGGVGTLSVGNLTWNGGGIIAHQLGPNGGIDSDLLLVNGNLVKPGGGFFTFHFSDGAPGPVCGTTYTLIHYTGSNGFAAGDFTFTYSGASGVAPDSAFAIDGAGGNVQFTAHCFTDQAITNFASTPANPAYADGGTFSIDATPGGSTSPLVFGSNTPSVCTVSGSIVTMHARGVCTLTADQAGDSLRNPAPTVFLTKHFEQFTVASSGSAHGTIDPPSQTIDYGAAASFTVVAESGYVAALSGDTCTVTHATGNTWTTGPITDDCNVTAQFIDRVFADGFEPSP